MDAKKSILNTLLVFYVYLDNSASPLYHIVSQIGFVRIMINVANQRLPNFRLGPVSQPT